MNGEKKLNRMGDVGLELCFGNFLNLVLTSYRLCIVSSKIFGVKKPFKFLLFQIMIYYVIVIDLQPITSHG